MWRPGPMELLIILAVVLLLFGPKQIPKLSKMFGKAVKDMKEGLEGKDEAEKPEAMTEAQTDAAADETKKPEESAV